MIINHEETRMVMDREDKHGLQTKNLKNVVLSFLDAQTVS